MLPETAISKRLRDIENNPEHSVERHAIEEAISTLQNIQIKTFGHSDWQI
jgi:hypothetical protein